MNYYKKVLKRNKMIDKWIYAFFGGLDKICSFVDNLWNFFTAPRCKCGKKKTGAKNDR